MFKKTILLLFTVFICQALRAQTAAEIYDQYLDFNLARLQGENDKVLKLGEKLIPVADKLPEKARISFYFSAGKMYEDNNQNEKARPYYEMVAAAVPNYYVVHRALGYLYLADAQQIEKKLNTATNNKTLNATLATAYNNAVKKALPQLEKAQACDPSPETLAIIQMLYKSINDAGGAASLNSRLKQLSINCLDILNDQ